MLPNLRQLRLLLALVAALAAGPAAADASAHEAAVKAFFKVAKMNELIDSTLVQMTEMQVKANPAMAPYRDILLKFFQKYMSWASLEPDLTKLYVAEFTEAEIAEISRFYQTPVGQKVMKKLPELSARGATIGQARVQEHIGELQTMIAEQEAKKAAETAPPAPAAPKPNK